jgi:protein gp37
MSTKISWTDESWNPTTGCTHVSDGCRNCYAEAISLRYGWSTKPWTKTNETENVKLHYERLKKPYGWKKPRMIFVNSMSDLFHERISDDYILEVFKVMKNLPRHTFQVLTKRPERAASWSGPWQENIWMGVSVESASEAHRIETMRFCPSRVRFISYEPALGPLESVNLTGYHWLIVGGESGPRFRPMDMSWARQARDLCQRYGLAFFFKQQSGLQPGFKPYLEEGNGSRWEWHQYPNERIPPIYIGRVENVAYRESLSEIL